MTYREPDDMFKEINKELKPLRVGDTVQSINTGRIGTLLEIDPGTDYPYKVDFGGGIGSWTRAIAKANPTPGEKKLVTPVEPLKEYWFNVYKGGKTGALWASKEEAVKNMVGEGDTIHVREVKDDKTS